MCLFLKALMLCAAVHQSSSFLLIESVPDKQRTNKSSSISISAPGVECEVCEGGLCGVVPGRDPLMRCPDPTPYCLNIVNNDSKGSRHITKRCGSVKDCDHLWWVGSSDKEECVRFRPDDFYPLSFSCTFCCTRDQCNKDLYPAASTLYRGPVP